MHDYPGTTHISFPMGGIGAGMFCLEGSGSLGSFSLRNNPQLGLEPTLFAALHIRDGATRVLEGPVPKHKIFGYASAIRNGPGNGLSGKSYGLPRFERHGFQAAFPFATVKLYDKDIPLSVSVIGFSPFIPLAEDASSLPAASLTYRFENPTGTHISAVFSYNVINFLAPSGHQAESDDQRVHVHGRKNGFVQSQPAVEGIGDSAADFAVALLEDEPVVQADWFRGGWYDVLTMRYNYIKSGNCVSAVSTDHLSPGGAVALPFTLAPGESRTVTVLMAWYAKNSLLRTGDNLGLGGQCDCCVENKETYEPWYAAQYKNVDEVMADFTARHSSLWARSEKFSQALSACTLPDAVMDAVSANLSILKSPTLLRQTDGRLWAWEGCCDCNGCCSGSCTHVWNYAQALPHLFPMLERTLRQTEFHECQNEEGHQNFRTPLPIRPANHVFHAASDGQLGGIMKMHRDWRISGDTAWLRLLYPRIKDSMEYCIRTWDKQEEGLLSEPHHNTYDIEFWGADGMCTSFYLGALKAMAIMGAALSENVSRYEKLYERGRKAMEETLFNGEYFFQRVEWETLESKLNIEKENPQCQALLLKEGPKYQYGTGCLSDGVLGAWLAKVCGIGDIIDRGKVEKHLLSVYRYNYKTCLRTHENPQRPGYALGNEGGLLLCTWPHGGKPSLPFVYSDEVWTGIEYQVASHLLFFGHEKEALDIVRSCRARYDGQVRNPFNEYECGHWYARALASFALLQGLTGVWYDAVDKTLSVRKREDFTTFLCTASGYGLVRSKGNIVTLEVVEGSIPVSQILMEEQ